MTIDDTRCTDCMVGQGEDCHCRKPLDPAHAALMLACLFVVTWAPALALLWW